MNEARKNGPRPTKPKIAPFRLAPKANIKDAPIFEDIDHRKKKRVVKLVSSLRRENNESALHVPVKEEVKEAADQDRMTDVNPFGKMFAGSIEKTPATSRKIFGDPYKDKAADPFDIMTAEPDEEEPAGSMSVEPMSLTTETVSLTTETVSLTTETDESKSPETPEKDAPKSPEKESPKSLERNSPDIGKNYSPVSDENHSSPTGKKESPVAGNAEVKDETREEDILEVNAYIDSSTLKDTDDNNWEEEMAAKGEKIGSDKSGADKRHKKHKKSEKHDKGEKKKKRRKEKNKSEEESSDKRHKKHRRGSRSRNRSRSRSFGSKRRRDHSGNERGTFPDRSRERSLNQSHRGSNRRDLPGRFGSHQKSRSRSPIRRARSPRGGLLNRSASPKRRINDKVQSPPRRKSFAATSPREKSPREKSPREKFPKEKSAKEKSAKEKSPREKSPRERFLKGKSLEEKSPREKSSKEQSSKEKSPKQKISKERSPRERSPREKSPRLRQEGKSKSPEAKSPKERRSKDKSPIKQRRKSREEKSPRKNSGNRSPLHMARKKTDSESSASLVEVVKNNSADEQPQVIVIDHEVKESDLSMSSNVSESPSGKPQLKSYVQVVAKDPTPPVRIVPYLDDDDAMSLSPPRDSADGLNIQPEKELSIVQETEPVKSHKSKESKHKSSDETEPTKKLKVKRKSKKSQERKRKKKALAKAQALATMERNTDDELEDLLFTKTNKESKEDVFNDSDVFSAKHNLRTAVVELDMKKLRTVDSPARKEQVENKKLTPVIEDISIDSPLPYEPEKLSEISDTEKDVPTSQQPSGQAAFSTIPFLSVDEEPEVIDFVPSDEAAYSPVEQPDEDDNILYSPVEEPVEGGNVPYSPLEQSEGGDNIAYSPAEEPVSDFGSPRKSSAMNLSDISTKDTVVEKTVGVITTAEKVEEFLGSIQSPEDAAAVVDMDMSSPTNGMGPNSDDDIIEQLHKEFVRTQHTEDVTPAIYVDNHATHTSSIQQSAPSPLQTAARDPIVQAYGLSTNYGTILKPKHVAKRSKKKVKKSKEEKPFATEKKDIEDALNRVHRQARVEDEMKHALKVYFKRKDITKDEYKMILRKAVPQVANSNHGIDPERIRSLVKKYVAKYKGSRERRAKSDSLEQQDIPFTFSP